MARQISYSAFISYRHCPPDSQIAERLQRKLENFRLPKEVAAKVGKSRLRRVFRDETELSVAEDLSEVINTALRNSDYLIAICSPRYLESVWCRKEIETFLKIRDRKHILLVLAEGEPETSFPEILMYDEVFKEGPDGQKVMVRRPREPLAADCRGENKRERHANVDKAVIKLAAAMLGLKYDDLEQRYKKAVIRRAQKRILTVFSVMALIIALCVVFLVMIARQNEIIRQRYADTIAATSDNLLRDGKRMDALYAARLGLPDSNTGNYSENAVRALTNALGVYDPPNTFACDGDIRIPSSFMNNLYVSPSGKYFSVMGLNSNRYVLEAATGEVVSCWEEDGISDFSFDGDKGFVYQRTDETYKYFDLTTLEETDLGFREAYTECDANGEGYVFFTNDGAYVYKGTECVWSLDYAHEGFSYAERLNPIVVFVPGTDEVWLIIIDCDKMKTVAYIVDKQTGGSDRMVLTEDSQMLTCSTDGKTIAWRYYDENLNYKYRVLDIETGEVKICNVELDDIYDIGVRGDDIVFIGQEIVYLFNRDLVFQKKINVKSYIQRFITDAEMILVDNYGGCYRINNGDYEYLEPNTTEDVFSWEKTFTNGTLFVCEPGSTHVYTYTFRQSDYLTRYFGEYEEFGHSGLGDTDVNRFRDLVMEKETEFTMEDVYMVTLCTNADAGIIQLWDEELCIYDSVTGERLKTIYSTEGTLNGFYYDEEDGYYYISTWDTEVFDVNFRYIYSIKGCIIQGVDRVTGDPVVTEINADPDVGDKVMYLVHPVTYDKLISIADEMLKGYEPDERVSERYGI
ncbi:TIR domain-containing protein [Ruminococcaceae bacterium YRB3002]|nr:TIR domain-containing protein [Ruminococcaceae bacterium YRB3002]